LGDLVIKYPKTPGSLMMRAIEYSPAGFLKSAYELASPLLRGKAVNSREVLTSLSRAITGTAISELFLDGSSVRAILPATNALWNCRVQIAAICTAQGNGTTTTGGSWIAEYVQGIKRIGTSTALVGTTQTVITPQHDRGLNSAAITITADDASEALKIEFTPPSNAGTTTTFRVVATIHLTQIKY
jgi:hypothetical protein